MHDPTADHTYHLPDRENVPKRRKSVKLINLLIPPKKSAEKNELDAFGPKSPKKRAEAQVHLFTPV